MLAINPTEYKVSKGELSNGEEILLLRFRNFESLLHNGDPNELQIIFRKEDIIPLFDHFCDFFSEAEIIGFLKEAKGNN